MYAVREAKPDDVHTLAALLRAYMRETYNSEWRGSALSSFRTVSVRASVP